MTAVRVDDVRTLPDERLGAARALALFTIGALITVITGRPAIASGARQLAIGAAAAAIAFAVGKLVGVAVS